MPKAKSKRRNGKTKATPQLSLRRFSKQQLFLIAGLLIAGGLVYIVASRAAGPGYDTSANAYDTAGQAQLVADQAHGVNYDGLKLVKSTANHPCHGAFEVEGVKTNGKPLCSHGPDSSVAVAGGAIVTATSPETRINQLLRQSGNYATTPQIAAATNPATIANDVTSGAFSNPYPITPIPCSAAGHRVKLVLISNIAVNSYTSIAKSLLQQTAHRLEGQLEYSALHSGPGSTNRHFRFVNDAACEPTVATVITPSSTPLTNYSQVAQAMVNHGYKDPNIKYLIWDYTTNPSFCGVGSVAGDDQPSVANNASNNQTGYAVVAPGCWGTNSELHELSHGLGAVNLSAPHTSGGYHCIDDHDVMCYADKAPDYKVATNGKTVYVAGNCTNQVFEFLLDCNDDDYFNTGTAAKTAGNYLNTHWNVANSPFLQ